MHASFHGNSACGGLVGKAALRYELLSDSGIEDANSARREPSNSNDNHDYEDDDDNEDVEGSNINRGKKQSGDVEQNEHEKSKKRKSIRKQLKNFKLDPSLKEKKRKRKQKQREQAQTHQNKDDSSMEEYIFFPTLPFMHQRGLVFGSRFIEYGGEVRVFTCCVLFSCFLIETMRLPLCTPPLCLSLSSLMLWNRSFSSLRSRVVAAN